MIVDQIENCEQYYRLHKDFQRVFEWMKNAKAEKLNAEKYILEEGKLWISVQRYTSKPRQECRVEGHESFIDIQYVLLGCEMMGYEYRGGKAALTPYDARGDIQFFDDECDLITIPAGSFYIAYPDDLHMTKCQCGQPQGIVKLVAKVKCED